MAAENGAAAGDTDQRQRPTAREARFARASVDEELLLLRPHAAPRVPIRIDGAAPVGDRDLQRVAKRLMKPLRRLSAEAPGQAVGTQPRAVQRLVRVDVADTRDRRLVQEDRLESRLALAEPPVELLGSEFRIDGFRTKTRHRPRLEERRLCAQQQTAETARVGVAQLASILQVEDGLRVLDERR